jgi:hypothetical protein
MANAMLAEILVNTKHSTKLSLESQSYTPKQLTKELYAKM